MIKKTLIAFAITIVLAVGVLGAVNTTYAQEIEAPTVENKPVGEPIEENFAYQYAYQLGDQNGDADPVRTQTRTQTQTRELQDGECARDGEQQHLRIHQGEGNQGVMRQQQLKLGDGTCTGDCVQIRQNGRGK